MVEIKSILIHVGTVKPPVNRQFGTVRNRRFSRGFGSKNLEPEPNHGSNSRFRFGIFLAVSVLTVGSINLGQL